MTIPSTTIHVRPGWASYLWSYAGAAIPTATGESAITAVAFDATGSLGQELSRGSLQYSQDKGQTWLDYTAPQDDAGAWLPATGLVWRFQDRDGTDFTPNTFSVHYLLADGSTVTFDNTVIVDHPPASLASHNDLVFSTMPGGALVDTLAAVDNGALTNARWVIDSQSHPGLFAIGYDPAVDTTARLVLADRALLPDAGLTASVTVHYYDRFQLDAFGNPIPGQGVARTLDYVVEDGVSHSLAGLGRDLALGAGMAPAWGSGADPALARLAGGGFVAVWQAPDAPGGAGLRAQVFDAAGKAAGGAFALTPDGDAGLEGQPAVAALADGRLALAYAIAEGEQGRIGWRFVAPDGTVGPEHVLAGGARGDAAMPSVAALGDGSFALAWRSGGAVHVQCMAADGTPDGAQQDHAALGSAFSPALAALPALGARAYVVSWGEINDGNVYAATGAAGNGAAGAGSPPFVVGGDGYAASISTAAPLPHVAGLADGGFVVAWDSYANAPYGFTHSDVFFQRFDAAGQALGTATQANVDSFGGRYDAAATALSDGNFMLAWQAGDGDGDGIYGRRFGLDGAPVDEREFAINEGLGGDQSGADLVGLPGGGFAAVWTDVAPGGGAGVEARVLPGAVAQGMGAGSNLGTLPASPAAPKVPVVHAGLALAGALLVSVQPDQQEQQAGAQLVGVPHGGIDYLFGG